MPTEITVRGSASAFEPPERATVHVSVAYEGPAMEPVYARVAQDLEKVKATVSELNEGADAAVTTWSAGDLRTWSNRPYNREGKQMPLVHHASAAVEVEFRDFSALSRWAGDHIVGTEGFRVSRVAWTLTPDKRDRLLEDIRTRAVSDAVGRAQLYADALGLGAIRPVAVADSGMLGAGVTAETGYATARFAAAPSGAGGAPEVEFMPEDIEVSATVDARFVADQA